MEIDCEYNYYNKLCGLYWTILGSCLQLFRLYVKFLDLNFMVISELSCPTRNGFSM